ncbi:MAG: tetratricopeptide repeat protein, partial [Paracoccaceae bacterium]|nr:tetratricopeptide repeat protein [Paracoccaceae bacterium]
DPGNAGWARDVSFSLNNVGNIRVAAGDRDGALAAYEESLAIFRDLSARDPGNARWARDVSVSLNKVGDIRVAAGDRDGALAAYEESLAIARDLSARDPGNAGWARGVAVSLWSIADLDKENAAERWLLVITQLEAMDERGVLFEEDRQFMDAARENLRASERDSDD